METECIELFERDFKRNLSKKHEETGFTVKDLGPRQNTCSQGFNLQFCRKKFNKTRNYFITKL